MAETQVRLPKSWIDGGPITRFRLSDNKRWATEFEARDYEEFTLKFVDALSQSRGRLVSLHNHQGHAWYNVGGVKMGVFYDGVGRLNSSPGRYEIRGNGFSFLSVSPEQPVAQEVWRMICNCPPTGGVPTVDCRAGGSPGKQNLNDLYNELVSRARNYRRQLVYASPQMPINRASEREAQFDGELNTLAQQYRDAALAYRPQTDWADWERYVRQTLHPEIANIICQFVLPSFA